MCFLSRAIHCNRCYLLVFLVVAVGIAFFFLLCLRQLLGFVFGGVVNNYVSFPTTCTIFGEVVLSEVK